MPPSPRRRAAAQPVRALATRPPLRRLLWALQRLRSGKPLRATDLAREFEVAVRTAYRDLDFLRDEWRVPVEYDHHQGTYWLTEPVASLPLLSLSQGELVGQGHIPGVGNGPLRPSMCRDGGTDTPRARSRAYQALRSERPSRPPKRLLLRSDLHTLLDRGYVTVTPELRFEVSPGSAEEFENGRDYYALHGRSVRSPERSELALAREYLDWHASNVFRG
jgi:hypothetical protein